MQKKFQVFVSSTYQDLIDERQDAIKSVLDLGHIPSGMEAFHAADFEQFTYIKKIIDECDYYVLVIGGRYGSVNEYGISYTELEYDYAVETGKIVLAFLHSDPSQISQSKCETDTKLLEKLESFRQKVSTRRLVSFWSSRHDLKATVIISLSKAFSDLPGTGWMRADAVASEDLLSQINQLRQANDEMKSKLSSLKPPIEIPDLAGLDDAFAIGYETRSSYAGQTSTRTSTKTWREMFSIVGPRFLTTAWSTEIRSALQDNLKRAGSFYSATIGPEVTSRIRQQFELLGLISFSYASSKEGSGGEAGNITSAGRAVLAETLAVRKKT